MDLDAIQAALREAELDGWLFYDFHRRDVTAYRILGLSETQHAMRRWYYWVPASGEPVRLVHGVEATALDDVPGKKTVYVTWQSMHAALGEILEGAGRVAMQYSPDCDIPYVSLVDSGTVELVRRVGDVDVVSSANLVALFEATFGAEGVASHRRAMEIVHTIKDEAFAKIAGTIGSGDRLTEYELGRFIQERFVQEGLDAGGDMPIVGVDGHPANPHFEPTEQNAVPFAEGQTVLIDLWAREARPEGIYADITWCGYIGSDPPEEYRAIWKAVTDARDAASSFVIGRFEKGDPVQGWEVDQVSRDVITAAGYGDYFIHRTGHSIGHEVHGNGANIDNFETRDSRSILPGTCFSIEPGIYLADRMAARTEIDVLVLPEGKAEVSGPVQEDLILIP